MADDTKPESPPTLRGTDLRTFLIADIRGYTRYTREHGDEAASAVTARFATLVREAVSGFDGELLELRGDEALCVFTSARQALRAAVDLQRRLRTPVEGRSVFVLGVGIGLDAGEAVPTEGGYRGSALNLAARLCGLAAPGEVLATDGVVHLASRVDGLRFQRRRPVRLKGVEEPVRLVEVVSEQPLPPAPAAAPHLPLDRSRRMMALAGLTAVIVAIVAVALVALTGNGTHQASPSVAVRPNSIAVIDAANGTVVHDIRLAGTPGQVTAGAGGVWAGEEANQSIAHINPGTFKVVGNLGVGIDPAQMLVAFDSLWVYDAVGNQVAVVDPTGRQQTVQERVLPPCPPFLGTTGQPLSNQGACGYGGIAADSKGVWLGRKCLSRGCADTGAWRINPQTLRHGRRIPMVGDYLAYGGGALWGSGQGWNTGLHVARATSPSTHMQWSIPNFPSYTISAAVTYAFGAAWVVAPNGFLYKYTEAGLQSTVKTPQGGYAAVRGDRWLWVISASGVLSQDQSVYRDHRAQLQARPPRRWNRLQRQPSLGSGDSGLREFNPASHPRGAMETPLSASRTRGGLRLFHWTKTKARLGRSWRRIRSLLSPRLERSSRPS